MTERDFFIHTIADEAPRFERVFKALPGDKLDYRPDPKSRTALELAGALASEAVTFTMFLNNGSFDVSSFPPPPADVAGVAETFAKGLADAKAKAESMTEEDWSQSEAKMTAGEQELWKTTKGQMAWGLLLDLIHHRGQLATYIRPMGGKVPSIYGPSADSE